MYVLVYAPQGIVGEYGSSVRVFEEYDEAFEVMKAEASYDPEFTEDEDDLGDEGYKRYSIDQCHATNDTSDPDAAEWHIYVV